MDASEANERLTYLLKCFEQGIWVQHLKDQKNSNASVRGVRFFFAEIPLPVGNQQPSQDPSSYTDTLMRGTSGYVCVTPKTVSSEGEGVLKVSLDCMKDMLVKKKAWDTNKKAYAQLMNMKVPVIFMSVGRPVEGKFGTSDRLLGLFHCTPLDPDVLSCTLTTCESDCGLVHLTPPQELDDHFDSSTRAARKRRRELPVYYATGCLMGIIDRVAVTGAHSKELYVRSLQSATSTIRLNAYCISDLDVVEELRRASERGVVVKLRYDHRQQAKTNATCLEDDRLRLVEVHPVVVSEDDKLLMHKKELIVDAGEELGFVLLGSYNPTSTARGSQESVVRVQDAYVVETLQKRFDWDWKQEEEGQQRGVKHAVCAT